MIKSFKKIGEKPFVRNVIILASGTAMAQIIALASSPVITRLYGPQAFGLMGTFTAIVSIIGPLAALTYPVAIVIPKRDQDALSVIRLSLIITMIISLISMITITFFNKQIANIFNLNEISAYLFLIPLVIIFAGLMQVAEQWLIRTKQFSINARVTVLQSIIINGSKIGFGYIYPVATILIILNTLADGLRAVMMIFFAKQSNYQKKIELKTQKRKLKELAKDYNDFPIYRAPQVFIEKISQNLPILMLTAFFGPASAGFYAIGKTVLNQPHTLISGAVGNVFYPRIVEAFNNKENITLLIKKTTFALFVVGILPFGIIILFGPFLFSFVFGSDWITAGEYARWIALFSFSEFINRPSVRTLPVLNAQKFYLNYTIIWLIIRIGLLSIGYFIFSSDYISIALFAISSIISNILLITITLKVSRKKVL